MVPELTVSGQVGSTSVVQYADAVQDPDNWKTVTNLVLKSASQTWYDSTIQAGERRFYRVIPLSGGTSTNLPSDLVSKMAWMASGTFKMGSPDTDPDRVDLETPVSTVILSKGYWISKFEVTQQEFQDLMGYNPSYFQTDPRLPVESVSWSEAVNYCTALTAQEKQAGRLPLGYVYSLPTEAQWEYAARAGTATRFSFGDDPNYTLVAQYAWTAENSADATHPVGQKKPNGKGIFDMSGNVFEWCRDFFAPYGSGDKVDPQGPSSGSDRAFRGGSWGNTAAESRSAARGGLDPSAKLNSIGFRVVITPVAP